MIIYENPLQDCNSTHHIRNALARRPWLEPVQMHAHHSPSRAAKPPPTTEADTRADKFSFAILASPDNEDLGAGRWSFGEIRHTFMYSSTPTAKFIPCYGSLVEFHVLTCSSSSASSTFDSKRCLYLFRLPRDPSRPIQNFFITELICRPHGSGAAGASPPRSHS
jgi:hypothetical protein